LEGILIISCDRHGIINRRRRSRNRGCGTGTCGSVCDDRLGVVYFRAVGEPIAVDVQGLEADVAADTEGLDVDGEVNAGLGAGLSATGDDMVRSGMWRGCVTWGELELTSRRLCSRVLGRRRCSLRVLLALEDLAVV
jgi:hypothetical protein